MASGIYHTVNEKGDSVVVMSESKYSNLKKRLAKLEHIETTAQSFEEVKLIEKGLLKKKTLSQFLEEV